MKEEKQSPEKVWSEYEKGVEYLTEKNIYNIVKKNEDFYNGKQWEGITPDVNIAKPTMNVLQRIGKYQIAMLSSNDVGMSIKSMLGTPDENDHLKVLTSAVKDVIEQAKIIENARVAIKNGFVGGACYMMQLFEPDYETGQDSRGRITNELINIRRMYFGNPFSNDIQKQPYIIVALRQYAGQVREEAKDMGVKNWEDIKPDTDWNYDDDHSNRLCTVLIKFYKVKHTEMRTKTLTDAMGMPYTVEEPVEVKTVHFVKCTKDVMLIPETDLGYTRYPISRFGWDIVEDSYLYESPMTSNIVNQVFINKSYAYCHEYSFKSAFPKRIFDAAKVDMEEWDANGDLGIAGGDLAGTFLKFEQVPDFSQQILTLIENTESEVEKNMGVNDAALGNIKPDNASAIMQLQEAAAVPLEIIRQNYYEMWEDTIRNIIDIMISTYGIRKIVDEDGNMAIVDFAQLRGLNFKLKVDIGSSAQYSEIAQVNNLTALLQQNQINLSTFLEAYPDKYIPNKQKLLEYARQKEQAEMMAATQIPVK